MNDPIRILHPQLPTLDQLTPYLRRIDQSLGRYTNGGPLVQELENAMSVYLSAPTVTVANATLGLELCLQACNLRQARVLIPALTYRATATAVTRTGNHLVLGDVDPETWQLTPAIAERYAGRIDAVIPVATFGRPVEVEPWEDFSARHAVPVILDAAAAFGRQGVGELAAVVFSLHATKALAAAEGGIVASHDGEILHRVAQLARFEEAAATNAKMSEYHAAVALAMLDQWTDIASRRDELRQRYLVALRDQRIVYSLQLWPSGAVSTYMVVNLLGRDAHAIEDAMQERDIETRRWYRPTVDQWMGMSSAHLSETKVLREQLLGLPFHLNLSNDDVYRVCETLREVL